MSQLGWGFMNKKIIITLAIYLLPHVVWADGPEQVKNGPYTLREVIELTKQLNYKTRAKAFSVYRAKAAIDVAANHLAPHFTAHMALEIINQDYYTVASHFVGFLFPSNWYDFFEAKELSQAEIASFKALLANQINGSENTYYEIAMYSSLLKSLKKTRDEFVTISDSIKSATESGSVDPLPLLEERLAHKDLDVEINDTVAEIRSMKLALAQTIGLPSPSWDSFDIAELTWPEELNLPTRKSEDLEEIALRRSHDLVMYNALIRASRENTESRKWRWFHNDSDNEGSFGIGYVKYVETGEAHVGELLVQKDEMKTNIRRAVREAISRLDQYRTSFQLKKETQEEIEADIVKNEQRYKDGDQQLEDYAKNFGLEKRKLLDNTYKKIGYATKFLRSYANLNRLLLEQDYYQNLDKLIPKVLPQDHAWWRNFVFRNQGSDGYEIEQFKIGGTDIDEGHLYFDEDDRIMAVDSLEGDFEDGKWEILQSGKIKMTFIYKGRNYIALGSLRKTDYLLADDVSFSLKVYTVTTEGKAGQQVGVLLLTD